MDKNLVIYANTIEKQAKEQIGTLMNTTAYSKQKVRIMPDVHSGKGSVIGFTSTFDNYIIPNTVGVDIGCGMFVMPLKNRNLTKKELKKIDKQIRESVPSGMNIRETVHPLTLSIDPELELVHARLDNISRLLRSIGTLGGGNHFIEIDKGSDGQLYLVIHSGSRNLGVQVCKYYQEIAKTNHEEKFNFAQEQIIKVNKINGTEQNISAELNALSKLKNSHYDGGDLAYITGSTLRNYIDDMNLCQNYAHLNRITIAKTIVDATILEPDKDKMPFTTLHNYIDIENSIIRKGAIRAAAGESVLIPLNMADGCILGEGLGNEDWNCSAPHGAGRVLSRNAAKKKINIEEYKDKMKDVFSTSVCRATLDEAPQAYKNSDEIIDIIKPTVKVKDILKPIYNFKALS